jgi:hypothetical protein
MNCSVSEKGSSLRPLKRPWEMVMIASGDRIDICCPYPVLESEVSPTRFPFLIPLKGIRRGRYW